MNTILILLGIIFGCGLLGAILQIAFGDKRQTNDSSNIQLTRNQNDYSVLNENFKPTSKQDAINRINYLKTEQRELKSALDRHEKIIQESLNIMYSSKNLDVIKRRFDAIYENHTYIEMYRDKGYDIKFDLDFIKKLRVEYNKIIIDLAEFKIDEYETKYKSLKSELAKDNYTKKTYQLIDTISKSFKNPTEDDFNQIEKLKNKIEDIYS